MDLYHSNQAFPGSSTSSSSSSGPSSSAPCLLRRKQNELRKVREAIGAAQQEIAFLQQSADRRRDDFPHRQVIGPVDASVLTRRDATYPVWKTRREEENVLNTEAEVLRKVRQMKEQNVWTDRNLLTKRIVVRRNKTHQDYLLEEMAHAHQTMTDERQWRKALMRTCGRRVQQYHRAKQTAEAKRVKDDEANLRKIAREMAKGIKKYWDDVEKTIAEKCKMIADEKKNRLLMQKQERIIQNAEKITRDLHDGAQEDGEDGEDGRTTPTAADDGGEFDVEMLEDEEDNEETLEEEERLAALAGESDGAANEVDELQKLAEMDIDELRAQLAGQSPGGKSHKDEVASVSSSSSTSLAGGGAHPPLSSDRKTLDEQIAAVNAAQPTGVDLSTTRVRVRTPKLLTSELTLRPYQHIGLDWLVMLHHKSLNGILADEMGLGKTVMTIALFAHLASECECWGPHLIIVPTSVILNWEIECKRWCPSLKVLSYYGPRQRRQALRKGWGRQDAFHVCITSYNVILQEPTPFRRKRWAYMVLDEAQHIKNWRSKKWQTLLTFSAEHRLLLTGTPLQNNLIELWSLLHFLMPWAAAFESQSEFRHWFANPVGDLVQGNRELTPQNEQILHKLHSLLRPFILRRMKREVEKQLPRKYHHVIRCPLSKRQRILYDDFMHMSSTRQTLAQGHYAGLVGVLMSLRKVCNHPDLFAGRMVVSPFDQPEPIELRVPRLACGDVQERLDDRFRSVRFVMEELLDSWAIETITKNQTPLSVFEAETRVQEVDRYIGYGGSSASSSSGALQRPPASVIPFLTDLQRRRQEQATLRSKQLFALNSLRCRLESLGITSNLCRMVQKLAGPGRVPNLDRFSSLHDSDPLLSCHVWRELVLSDPRRIERDQSTMGHFVSVVNRARSRPPALVPCFPITYAPQRFRVCSMADFPNFAWQSLDPFRPTWIASQLGFPDKALVQYDCGKLRVLSSLLPKLRSEGSRVLIFTQMSKMLDVLEEYLCMHGYIYLRLDGSTKVEERQYLMERFNRDSRIFCFILSTRSGGLGVNLTGANVVIFYDSDWNPAMDLQAQDRCHRIGQTKDVHIYRLISEHTVEENIYKKVQEKKMLVNLTLKGGQFGGAGILAPEQKPVNIREFFHSYDEDMDQDEILRLQRMVGEDSGEASMEPPANPDDISAEQNEMEESVESPALAVPKEVEQAFAQAEDDEDRVAYIRAKAEVENEVREMEETFDPSTGFQPVNVQRMEEEFASKLKPLQRRSMAVFAELFSDRLKDMSVQYKEIEEEYEQAAREAQAIGADDLVLPGCAGSPPDAVPMGSVSPNQDDAKCSNGCSSVSSVGPSSINGSHSPPPPNHGQSVPSPMDIDQGGNHSLKRPGDPLDDLSSSSKRSRPEPNGGQSTSQHPNESWEEPEGACSSLAPLSVIAPQEDSYAVSLATTHTPNSTIPLALPTPASSESSSPAPTFPLTNVVTRSFPSGVQVLCPLPPPPPVPYSINTISSTRNEEGELLFYEAPGSDTGMFHWDPFRGIQFDIDQDDLDLVYGLFSDRMAAAAAAAQQAAEANRAAREERATEDITVIAADEPSLKHDSQPVRHKLRLTIARLNPVASARHHLRSSRRELISDASDTLWEPNSASTTQSAPGSARSSSAKFPGPTKKPGSGKANSTSTSATVPTIEDSPLPSQKRSRRNRINSRLSSSMDIDELAAEETASNTNTAEPEEVASVAEAERTESSRRTSPLRSSSLRLRDRVSRYSTIPNHADTAETPIVATSVSSKTQPSSRSSRTATPTTASSAGMSKTSSGGVLASLRSSSSGKSRSRTGRPGDEHLDRYLPSQPVEIQWRPLEDDALIRAVMTFYNFGGPSTDDPALYLRSHEHFILERLNLDIISDAVNALHYPSATPRSAVSVRHRLRHITCALTAETTRSKRAGGLRVSSVSLLDTQKQARIHNIGLLVKLYGTLISYHHGQSPHYGQLRGRYPHISKRKRDTSPFSLPREPSFSLTSSLSLGASNSNVLPHVISSSAARSASSSYGAGGYGLNPTDPFGNFLFGNSSSMNEDHSLPTNQLELKSPTPKDMIARITAKLKSTELNPVQLHHHPHHHPHNSRSHPSSSRSISNPGAPIVVAPPLASAVTGGNPAATVAHVLSVGHPHHHPHHPSHAVAHSAHLGAAASPTGLPLSGLAYSSATAPSSYYTSPVPRPPRATHGTVSMTARPVPPGPTTTTTAVHPTYGLVSYTTDGSAGGPSAATGASGGGGGGGDPHPGHPSLPSFLPRPFGSDFYGFAPHHPAAHPHHPLAAPHPQLHLLPSLHHLYTTHHHQHQQPGPATGSSANSVAAGSSGGAQPSPANTTANAVQQQLQQQQQQQQQHAQNVQNVYAAAAAGWGGIAAAWHHHHHQALGVVGPTPIGTQPPPQQPPALAHVLPQQQLPPQVAPT